jgi:hypothetical protein
MHEPEALLRANAEGAAGAVLLLPWGGSDASELPSTAADVGLVDANIMAAARHLRSLNPHMQVGQQACEIHMYVASPSVVCWVSWHAVLVWRIRSSPCIQKVGFIAR